MATNVDKAFNQAPLGLQESDNPEGSGIEVELPPADGEEAVMEVEVAVRSFDENLAEQLDESKLQTMASELATDIDNDRMSRRDWEQAYIDGLALLGLKYEERTEPWDGACGVFHPVITEAVVRFQSEAITETFPAAGPVRTKIIGKETPDKLAAAQRVEHDMNYELTDVMHEFRPEHERMLWSLPATGSAFKKVYYDTALGRQTSVFVAAEDIILPYGTTDLQTCRRITHVMRKTADEIRKLQAAGFYRDIVIDDTPAREKDDIQSAKDKETGFSDLNDERHVLYECHVDLVLEGDEKTDEGGQASGLTRPYVVTMMKGTNEVLAIRRNWLEEDKLELKRQHFVQYQYVPGFGAYGFGLFHLVGGFARSATSIMRQLVDAGTLSNLPGGLKSKGLRIKGDDTPIAPGEFRDVDVGSGTIKDNVMTLPYKEPSATLYQLLTNIVDEARRFMATADIEVSDMSAEAPVGTTLALLERQLKVMTAIQARLHYSMKQELRLLAGIIRDYTSPDYEYDPDGDVQRQAKKDDYRHVDIIPVSDPNASTMSQRVVQYQAVIQLSQTAPQIYDMPQLHRGMLEVLGIKNADKLVPLPDDQKPKDPVAENMAALRGTPLKAFQYQDHQSHIQVHMAAMNDPIIMQLMGQNPKAQEIMSAMMAHVAEHVGYAYRQKIEQQLGMPLPPEDEPLPPQVELALSGMMAQAANQVLQQSQQQASQQQAQQQAQDPVLQMQQQELALKKRELDIKEKKVIGDLAAKADELDLRMKEIEDRFSLGAGKMVQDSVHKKADIQQQVATRAHQKDMAQENAMSSAMQGSEPPAPKKE